MSVIGKTPFVHGILGSLSDSEITTLKSLADSLGSATLVDLFGANVITSSNIGVTHVIMGLEQFSNIKYDGILCYHDASHCALFVVNDSLNEMQAFNIDPTNRTYSPVHEHLTAEEFRRVLDDTGEGGGDTWVATMKDKLQYDSTNSQIVDSKGLHIEGKNSGNYGLVVDEYAEFNKHVEIADATLKFKHGSNTVAHVNFMPSDNVLDIYSPGGIQLNDYVIPALPSGYSSKTFVLKLVNGTLTWVEEA